MHPLPYEVKRAHWRVTYKAIRRFEDLADRLPTLKLVTPARLDILHMIERRLAWTTPIAGRRPTIAFGELVRKLGLSPATISTCLKRMEELGLVQRFAAPFDRRRTIVTMTALGQKALLIGLRVLYSLREKLEAAATVIVSPRVPLTRRCRVYARTFGSWASPIYEPGFLDAD